MRWRRDRLAQRRKGVVTPTELRAEGVVEIGVVDAVAFVLTGVGLHLFHVQCIAARGYAADAAKRSA